MVELLNIGLTVNLKEICRLCMGKDSNVLPLFIEQDNLPERIKNFVPTLKLCIEDGLPTQVCSQCVQQVHESYNFKLQCEITDVTLRKLHIFRQSQNENVGSIIVKQELDINMIVEKDPLDFEELREQHTIKVENISLIDNIQEDQMTMDEAKYLQEENNVNYSVDSSSNTGIIAEICSDMKKKNVCKECGTHFPSRRALIRHMVMHKGEKNYNCRFCEKSYYFKNSLVAHYRTHPDEKSFECIKCDDKFSSPEDLIRHADIHRPLPESGIKFVCLVCGVS